VNGTTYHFWVTAVFAGGLISSPSPAASAVPLGIPSAAVISAYKHLLVEWASVDGAVWYDVYYSEEASMPYYPAFTDITELSQEIANLENGTTYYVWVKAKNYYANTNNASPMASGVPEIPEPGLYRGARRIGNQNLNTALDYIASDAAINGDYYIILGADESASDKDLRYYYGAIGITLLGYNQEIVITLNADTAMFFINYGVSLTLGENITLNGRSANNYPLVCLLGGNLVLNAGAKITGNKAELGGGVYIATGDFTMTGGTISGNTASSGGGVYLSSGNFTMTGGTISGNSATSFGGGVYIGTGTFQKYSYGGIIYGNEPEVAASNKNTADKGAAIYKSWYPRPPDFRDTTVGEWDYVGY
jgi:hypothetical protein